MDGLEFTENMFGQLPFAFSTRSSSDRKFKASNTAAKTRPACPVRSPHFAASA